MCANDVHAAWQETPPRQVANEGTVAPSQAHPMVHEAAMGSTIHYDGTENPLNVYASQQISSTNRLQDSWQPMEVRLVTRAVHRWIPASLYITSRPHYETRNRAPHSERLH